MGKKQINQYGTYEIREKRFKETFECMYPNFKYHSEYKTVDDYFKSECTVCGQIQKRHGQCTRPRNVGTYITCEACLVREVEERKDLKEKEKLVAKEIKIKTKLIQIIINRKAELLRDREMTRNCKRCGCVYKADYSDSVHCEDCLEVRNKERIERRKLWQGKLINCKECGKNFRMKNLKSKYCSEECLNKFSYRKRDLLRRVKSKHNGNVDYNITLDKLIDKDNSICGICGQVIDQYDYCINEDGYFIVGRNYPSIDHIHPVSKGGTHTWDNVQLAHHYCNSVKSDVMCKSVEDSGQLRIV